MVMTGGWFIVYGNQPTFPHDDLLGICHSEGMIQEKTSTTRYPILLMSYVTVQPFANITSYPQKWPLRYVRYVSINDLVTKNTRTFEHRNDHISVIPYSHIMIFRVNQVSEFPLHISKVTNHGKPKFSWIKNGKKCNIHIHSESSRTGGSWWVLTTKINCYRYILPDQNQGFLKWNRVLTSAAWTGFPQRHTGGPRSILVSVWPGSRLISGFSQKDVVISTWNDLGKL